MGRLITWIKNNKLAAFMMLVVFYLLWKNLAGITPLSQLKSSSLQYTGMGSVSNPAYDGASAEMMMAPDIGIMPPITRESPPTTGDERLVVTETNLSLLVGNVRDTSDKITGFTKDQGGYMVSSFITQPEEAPYATIIVRIPSEKLSQTLDYIRSLAIKVSSEYVSGTDVTDEYVDLEASLKTLQTTKTRFEEIMARAVEIDDILRVQREIINLQSQIDALKGRQQYLEGTAKLSRVTINMSTDEIALPYTPSETFRPAVIAKLAWRSLVTNLRGIAKAVIWLAVYSVIWAPALGLIIYLKRRISKSHRGKEGMS